APWSAAERAALAELRPYLRVVLEHVLLRARLADARAREATAAEEHEQLINSISHELRNPLAPILMWTSTLRRLRGDDAEVLRAATAIGHAVALERRLIEDLLDVSRLGRGVLQVMLETLDLREPIRQAIESRRESLTQARLSLVEELPADAVL